MSISFLLSQWENRINGIIPTYEICKRCKKHKELISFYDKSFRRKLCKECRDYNKIYCKKYFKDLKKI